MSSAAALSWRCLLMRRSLLLNPDLSTVFSLVLHFVCMLLMDNMKQEWIDAANYQPAKPIAQMTPEERAEHKRLTTKRNMARYKIRKAEAKETLEEAEDKLLEAYVLDGIKAGCPKDQMRNFIRAGLALQPKQLEFAAKCRLCDAPDGPTSIMFGGSRGGAKTYSLVSQIFADDMRRVAGLKCLILRKIGKANKEQIDDFRKRILINIPHNYREQAGEITLNENGSKAILGNYKDEKDLEKFIGIEYDLIAIEESNQLTFAKLKNIMSCLRTSKPDWRPRAYLTTNPGGIGHSESKKIYYDPWKEGREKETRYIHSTVYDNKFVNKEYAQYLESLTGWQRKAWLLGDWDFMAGAFFSNFDADWVVLPNKHMAFERSRMGLIIGSYDHGFSHPSCFHLHFQDREGNVFTMAEFHQAEMTIAEQAECITALLREFHLEVASLDMIAAGHDCFHNDPNGRTIASQFEEYGITLSPVKIDRVNGWQVMSDRLGNPSKNRKPTWFIHNECVNLIQQIQAAQCHETKTGDIIKMNAVEGQGGDDSLESARNGLVAMPQRVTSLAMPLGVGRYTAIGC